MADLPDVMEALGALLQAAVYPNGTSQPSVANCDVLIQSGWPDPASLQAQIKAKKAQVTIYPRPTERNTTRYPQTWEVNGSLQAATLTLNVAGQVVTVGGAQPSSPWYGQNLAVFVNGKPYIYRSLQTDTLTTIAGALTALIAVDVPGTSATGPAITVPSPARIGTLRVGTQAPVAQELKRQEREFQVIVWAPSVAVRDAIAKPIDVAIPQNKFLSLSDTSKARMIYKGSPYSDFDQKQGIYRRDFIATIEYATLATDTAPEAIAAETIVSQQAADGSTITPPISTTYN